MYLKRPHRGERRTREQILEHYEIEKGLAVRLKAADKEERKRLYSAVYDDLYRMVPCHPQLTQKRRPEAWRKAVVSQMRLLSGFLTRESVFLEIGPGDCRLSLEAARRVKKVYAVDISEKITEDVIRPGNFELVLSAGGMEAGIFDKNIDVAYSNQLMEHLHPDDALEQLKGVYDALVPGGVYICVTPHRFTGPHDISSYFDNVATGLHLKEYTNRELYQLFMAAGFTRMHSYLDLKAFYIKFPIRMVMSIERLLGALPGAARRRVSRSLLFRGILGIRVAAVK